MTKVSHWATPFAAVLGPPPVNVPPAGLKPIERVIAPEKLVWFPDASYAVTRTVRIGRPACVIAGCPVTTRWGPVGGGSGEGGWGGPAPLIREGASAGPAPRSVA